MARKIDYKNRSLKVASVIDNYGVASFELRWDKYDEVLYLVDEFGLKKKIWPPFNGGGYPEELSSQRNSWQPNALPNDNALTMEFITLTQVRLNFRSAIINSNLTNNKITFTPSLNIVSKTFFGDPTSTQVDIEVEEALSETLYNIQIDNIQNVIGDVNTLFASTTSPVPISALQLAVENANNLNNAVYSGGECYPENLGYDLEYISGNQYRINNLASFGGSNVVIRFKAYTTPFQSPFPSTDGDVLQDYITFELYDANDNLLATSESGTNEADTTGGRVWLLGEPYGEAPQEGSYLVVTNNYYDFNDETYLGFRVYAGDYEPGVFPLGTQNWIILNSSAQHDWCD